MMGRPLCVASAVLLLIFLLCANWLFSGVVREFPRDPAGDDRPLHCEALGCVEHYLLLLLGAFGGGRGQPSTKGSGSTESGAAVEGRQGSPLAADISVCHPSLTDADVPIYCCPPRRDADQTVVDFEFPDVASPSRRVRRPAHLVDAEYVAKYERAVAIMKSFPSDHPHNFLRQANNHCLYCTGSYHQVNSTALFKIHRSWLFFPWHRAFIYFHERILGKLIGDDTFALPFWNWDAPEGMVMPGMYTRGALNHTERDTAHLPPQVADLNYMYVESGLEAEEQVATNLAFMYNQMVSGARKAELFMGCKLKAGPAGSCDGPGTVENAPHNTLHSWVGSGLNPEREDMGAFYSAARDSSFYAHHANIDRLWEVWKKMRGLQHQPEFMDPEWLDSSFTFYDENLRFVRIKVRDCLDISKLGYAYEEVGLPWLKARPKPAVPPELARGILKKRDELWLRTRVASPELSGELGPQGGALDTTITTKVRRPEKIRTLRRGKEVEEEEVLVVYGIHVKGDTYAKFDVFVNLVSDERVAGPLSREFAGTFVNVPPGARWADEEEGDATAGATGVTLKLGISELLEDLGAGEDESVWVSLVPRGGTGADTTVVGIRIEYLG